ncbi:hypothetical protein ElyMa_005950000 [Elysia marginata]|uniref:Uncharacterized protein n=1 Tax=Elysia marginata TaxID=1093978 RepID=A0AAV4GA98_9GAST|nr:hypothetical protein ElyMa_005950000 [Elysia marginata]
MDQYSEFGKLGKEMELKGEELRKWVDKRVAEVGEKEKKEERAAQKKREKEEREAQKEREKEEGEAQKEREKEEREAPKEREKRKEKLKKREGGEGACSSKGAKEIGNGVRESSGNFSTVTCTKYTECTLSRTQNKIAAV